MTRSKVKVKVTGLLVLSGVPKIALLKLSPPPFTMEAGK